MLGPLNAFDGSEDATETDTALERSVDRQRPTERLVVSRGSPSGGGGPKCGAGAGGRVEGIASDVYDAQNTSPPS
jgi:hypothetical protein